MLFLKLMILFSSILYVYIQTDFLNQEILYWYRQVYAISMRFNIKMLLIFFSYKEKKNYVGYIVYIWKAVSQAQFYLIVCVDKCVPALRSSATFKAF